MKGSEASILFWDQLKELSGVDSIGREIKFHPARRWRFDFVVESESMRLAIEIDGGAFVQGRHNRGAGFVKDMEKQNHAAKLGWFVLRFTPQQVLRGDAIAFVREMLQ